MVKRISMSLPRKLLHDFDEALQDRGYNSRSKGIRDAIKDYMLRYKWMHEIEGKHIGILTILYDPSSTGVLERLTDIEHEHRENVYAVIKVPADNKNQIRVIAMNGEAKQIRNLTENLMQLPGVEHVKLTSSSCGD